MKPTTGGGIYYSLVSGALAADVLLKRCVSDDLSADRLAPVRATMARAPLGRI